MTRILSRAARGGLAVVLGLITLALSRWAPVLAEPPVDVSALPLVAWAVALAIVAALTARERRPVRWQPLAWGLAGAVVLLALLVAWRGPVGLTGLARTPAGVRALSAGSIDVTQADLLGIGAEAVGWRGPIRFPQSGRYGLRVEGRGRVAVRLEGRTLLEGEAERLLSEGIFLIGRGSHLLEVDWELTGSPEARGPGVRGHRLRLSWVRPRRNGNPGGVEETIPPRYLGRSAPGAYWWMTDALALLVALLVASLVLCTPWDRPARARQARPITRRELLVSLAAYAGLAVAMSWPLAVDLVHRGPLYREDGRLNAWILAWVGHALATDPARLFQAPIFHPAHDTLAFSENLLIPGLLAAPATLAGEPVLGYNLVFLLSAVVGGIGIQLLVRRAGADPLAAFVAGALFAFGAHRWARMAHLHAHVSLFLPFALLALDRFHERRSLRRALGVGLLVALQGLASIYLGAITATLVAVAVVVGILGGWRASALARLVAAGVLAAVLLAPLARPYLRMREANASEWSLAEIAPHEMTLESYLASGSRLWSRLSERQLDPSRVRQPLFPGLVLLVLGIAGLASAPRRFRSVGLAAAGAGLVLSLGSETPVHPWLHEHVVAFRGVRALGRFALLPVLSLSVLSGFALSRRPRAALLLLALGLVEAASVPLRFETYAHPPPAARWLAGREGAVLDWPLGEDDTQAMLEGIAHFRPLLNGYSGYTPRHYHWEAELMDDPAQPEALRYLRALGVTHVVAREPLRLRLAARWAEERVYLVPEGEPAREPEPGRAVATLWTPAGVTVDLGSPRALTRLVVPVGETVWQAPSQIEVSTDGRSFETLPAFSSPADAALSVARRPLDARSELRFACRSARFVRLSAGAALPGALEVGGPASCGPSSP